MKTFVMMAVAVTLAACGGSNSPTPAPASPTPKPRPPVDAEPVCYSPDTINTRFPIKVPCE